jgi:hypothetical protein
MHLVCVCLRPYVSVHVLYTCTCVCRGYVCAYVCNLYARTEGAHTNRNTKIRAHTHKYTYTHTHKQTHAHTHAHTHTHTHTQTRTHTIRSTALKRGIPHSATH